MLRIARSICSSLWTKTDIDWISSFFFSPCCSKDLLPVDKNNISWSSSFFFLLLSPPLRCFFLFYAIFSLLVDDVGNLTHRATCFLLIFSSLVLSRAHASPLRNDFVFQKESIDDMPLAQNYHTDVPLAESQAPVKKSNMDYPPTSLNLRGRFPLNIHVSLLEIYSLTHAYVTWVNFSCWEKERERETVDPIS